MRSEAGSCGWTDRWERKLQASLIHRGKRFSYGQECHFWFQAIQATWSGGPKTHLTFSVCVSLVLHLSTFLFFLFLCPTFLCLFFLFSLPCSQSVCLHAHRNPSYAKKSDVFTWTAVTVEIQVHMQEVGILWPYFGTITYRNWEDTFLLICSILLIYLSARPEQLTIMLTLDIIKALATYTAHLLGSNKPSSTMLTKVRQHHVNKGPVSQELNSRYTGVMYVTPHLLCA